MEPNDRADVPDPVVTIRLPQAHWRQIVSDIQGMCGCGRGEIEILSSVEVLEGSE